MATVTKIPASITKFTSAPAIARQKRRVAGYARVSTDHEDQANSYGAQVDYYTNYIKGRDDWEFVSVYADEGITGTNTKRRKGFQTMISEALAGNIDLIITKSVSRFARNTVDSLTAIRELKEHGVEVYFEKENIWTFDGKGELLLTIMSSLAQEESRSISENVTWGKRKRFADGKAAVPFSRFLGYDRGPDGSFVINDEQAKTVRLIYRLFLEGLSFHSIAKELTGRGIRTPAGKDKWSQATVRSILTNEKYKGDALLQKKFTVDFLTKKMKVNEGEVPQYYVEGNHPAIISPETFELVQSEMLRREQTKGRYSGVSMFSNKIKCAECGGWYGSKVWHSTDKYRRVIYRCNRKYENGNKCRTPHLTEDEIKEAFVKAYNVFFEERNEIIQNTEFVISHLTNCAKQKAQKKELERKMDVLVNLIQNAITENARTAQDQDEYQERYSKLARQYETAKIEYDNVCTEIASRTARRQTLERFLKRLKESSIVTEFDNALWSDMIDFVTADAKKQLVFTFKNGIEISL